MIAVGALSSLGGYLLLSQIDARDPLWSLVSGGALVVLGLSPMTVLTTDLVVASAPEDRAGSAAALSETSGELGVALGIAVMGTLLTAVYRLRLDLPLDLPADVRVAALEDVGSARSAAERVDPESARVIVDTAREAFATAFNTVGYVCAAITVGLAVLAAVGLRGERIAQA